MRRDLRAFLFDVVEKCRTIEEFTKGMTLLQYKDDEKARLAAERCFIIVGEALVCASRLTEDIAQELPDARKVIGFRNILVHNYTNYEELSDEKVWAIIHGHVPKLAKDAEAWLERLENQADEL